MSQQNVPQQSPEGECSYCGAELLGNFNFCTKCARVHTPQKIPQTTSLDNDDNFKSLQAKIRDNRPQVYTLFWAYFSAILLLGFLQILAFDEIQNIFYHLSSGAMVVLTVMFSIYYRSYLKPQFSLKNLLHRWAFFGLLLLVPVLLLNYGYHKLLFELTNIDSTTEPLRNSGMSTGMMVFYLGVVPAITEEISFRGLLQPWLRKPAGYWKSIIIASGMFAALHLSMINFFYFFLVGMVLGWVKRKTNQLYTPMAMHFLHNIAVLFLFSF